MDLNCKCRNCGLNFIGRASEIKAGRSTSCSRKCAIASRNQSGEKNPNWLGGIDSKTKADQYKSNYPIKAAAHREVTNALRNGTITRWPCEICSSSSSEAHHENYNRVFEITWLCKKHHLARHREIKKNRCV